ncbi:hypothetical protein [Actinacidiphila epipremni]|uniref:Chromosome segregation protein SMC n=1 Tax=Actinacidiphila epipremni TaxID=2053013 RepID=A0ABX0ZHH7_9ACTN|nr:hypothetical protein [Actinacidiphila epipremni]NJP43280.1 hypothetical protein [Actinacidiphila epipremni]
MSGSPKYSRAQLDQRRQQQLAEARRRREEAALRKQEKERVRRVRAEQAALRDRHTALAARAAAQRAGAADAGLARRHTDLTAALSALAAAIAAASDDAGLAAARNGVEAAEADSAALAVAVSAHLAREQRGAAVAALRASADAVPDRAEMDPAGARDTDLAFAEAERQVGSGERFPAAHRRLAAAVESHLARARERREELARARRAAAQAEQALTALLTEAEESAAELAGRAAAAELLRDLAAASRAADVPAMDRLTALAASTTAALATAFDGWLDELACTGIILDAISRALPQAGLRLEAGSVQQVGTGSMLTAVRAGGERVVLAVVPDGAGGAQLVYEAEGNDFTTRVTADGTVAACDLTAEVLEQFQQALEPEGVAAGELDWKGKPERPPAREAKQLPGTRRREQR